VHLLFIEKLQFRSHGDLRKSFSALNQWKGRHMACVSC